MDQKLDQSPVQVKDLKGETRGNRAHSNTFLSEYSEMTKSSFYSTLIGDDEDFDGSAEPRWCCMRGESSSYSRQDRVAALIKVIANVSNAALGSGLLAFPFAYSQAGSILGLIVTVLCGIVCAISLTVLAKCARNHDAATYPDLADKMYGHRGKQVMLIAQIGYTFATTVGYLIVLGTMVAPFISDNGSKLLHSTVSVCAGLAALPLCLMRSIDNLGPTSIIGVIAMLFTCTVIAYYGLSEPASESRSAALRASEPSSFNMKACAFQAVPVSPSLLLLL